MKSYQLFLKSTLAVLEKHPDPKLGIPVRWDNMPDDFVPEDGGVGAQFALVDLTQPEPEEGKVLERKVKIVDGQYIYGYFLRSETIEEYNARIAKEQVEALASARSAMSTILMSLPKESRAKFAEVRAGIENLLDVSDVEAAHYKLENTPTDTPAELNVKNTLVAALSNFIPE